MPELAYTEEKVSLIRRYPLETLVIILLFIVGVIGTRQVNTEAKVDTLNREMKDYLNKDKNSAMIIINANNELISKNNELIKKNTEVMSGVADYLRIRETRESLKD